MEILFSKILFNKKADLILSIHSGNLYNINIIIDKSSINNHCVSAEKRTLFDNTQLHSLGFKFVTCG